MCIIFKEVHVHCFCVSWKMTRNNNKKKKTEHTYSLVIIHLNMPNNKQAMISQYGMQIA